MSEYTTAPPTVSAWGTAAQALSAAAAAAANHGTITSAGAISPNNGTPTGQTTLSTYPSCMYSVRFCALRVPLFFD